MIPGGQRSLAGLVGDATIHPAGGTFRLQAVADPGHRFVQWIGVGSVPDPRPTVEIVITAERSLEAVFAPEP